MFLETGRKSQEMTWTSSSIQYRYGVITICIQTEPALIISGDPRGTKDVPFNCLYDQGVTQRRSDVVWLLYSRGHSHAGEPIYERLASVS